MGKFLSRPIQNIYEAAEKGDQESVKHFVKELKVNVNELNDDGTSALHLAAKNGHIDIVRYLVDVCYANVFLEEDTIFGHKPIHCAAVAGQMTVVRYFIEEKQMDPYVENAYGQTPALAAAEYDQYMVTAYFVGEQKVDAKRMLDTYGENMLFYSARYGHLSISKYLLDLMNIEFDLNQTNDPGTTIVFEAASQGKLNVLEYFVGEKHADVDVSDSMGNTPLHISALQKYSDIVKYLGQHGANAELRNYANISALEIVRKNTPQVMQYVKRAKTERTHNQNQLKTFKPLPISCTWIQNLVTGDYMDSVLMDFRADSSDYETLLVLADTCVRYMRRSHYQQAKHESLATPEEILQMKMDPVALNVINSEHSGFE